MRCCAKDSQIQCSFHRMPSSDALIYCIYKCTRLSYNAINVYIYICLWRVILSDTLILTSHHAASHTFLKMKVKDFVLYIDFTKIVQGKGRVVSYENSKWCVCVCGRSTRALRCRAIDKISKLQQYFCTKSYIRGLSHIY